MKRQTTYYIITLLLGIFVGWIFFHSSPTPEEKHDHAAEALKAEIWTCAMHPQIRMDKSGKCPICGMDLILLNQSTETVDPGSIHFSDEALALAGVLTSTVSKQNVRKEVRLYGKVQADERLVQSQVAHIPGRIEKLLVNFTGERVQKGQTLALIYSPELVTAQQELLETVKTKASQPEMYEASKEKLHQWKVTDAQISEIENSGLVKNTVEIVSNTTGIVTARRVNNGDYIAQGAVLYEIVDLSSVWLMFDAYESDLPFLNEGDKIAFTVQALPGINYTGNIKFIDPVLDPVTRVSKVRIEIGNPGGKLKPEMFATGIVAANLDRYANHFVIPRSSVLWTGKRSLVYVKQAGTEASIFSMREIELGPMLGNSYVVVRGLNEGEEIVTQGTFSVDAAAQLEGKPSMMNQDNEKMSTGHNHADVPNTVKKETPIDPSAPQQRSGPEPLLPDKKETAQHEMFKVWGNCEMCKARIEEAARSVTGVAVADWNVETKLLHVEFNPAETELEGIHKAIAKAGHDTERQKADKKTYEALPECCAYRK